jgi:uncharacterized coiled-coil protein SlyX
MKDKIRMTDLEGAKARLEQAVARLEEMVAEAREAASGDGKALADENAALKEKVTALDSALVESRREAASLQEIVGTVSDRLDHTIGQLKTVLED